MSLKHANLQMQNSKEELEQYGRRLCLRINGLLVKLDKTSDDVYKSVKKYLMRVNWICPTPWLFELIETSLLDWSWCSDYKTKCKAIIIRFTVFMHITLVYLARKKIILKQIILLDTIMMLTIKWEDELWSDSFSSSLGNLKEKLQIN